MEQISNIPGSDSFTQSLFGASITALYGNKVNTDIMTEVNTFIDSFEKSNDLFLNSAEAVTESLKSYEPASLEIEPPIADSPQLDKGEEDVSTADTINPNAETTQTPLPVDGSQESGSPSEEEATTQPSPQFKAMNDFINTLNDSAKFLNDNNRSKKTELLSKRLNYEFESRTDALHGIGIQRNEDGVFELSQETFEKAISENPEDLLNTLIGKDGFITHTQNRIQQASDLPAAQYAYDNVSELSYPTIENSYSQSYEVFDRVEFAQQIQLSSLQQKGSILDMLI